MIKYLLVFNSLVGLSINAIFQVLSFRYTRLSLLRSIFLGFAIGSISLFITEYYLIGTIRFNFYFSIITNFIIYSALGYCYFNFISLGETARRVRILEEIYNSKKGLSTEEILELYNSRNIIEARLCRLLNNGQIILKNGRYYIGKPIVLLIAKIVLIMKIFILGKKSEFD